MKKNLTKLDDTFRTWSSSKLSDYLGSMAQKINLLIDVADGHELEVTELRTMICDLKEEIEKLKASKKKKAKK